MLHVSVVLPTPPLLLKKETEIMPLRILRPQNKGAEICQARLTPIRQGEREALTGTGSVVLHNATAAIPSLPGILLRVQKRIGRHTLRQTLGLAESQARTLQPLMRCCAMRTRALRCMGMSKP